MANTDFNPPPAVQQQVNPFAKLIDVARQGLGYPSRLPVPQQPPPAQTPGTAQAALPPPSQPLPPPTVPRKPDIAYSYIPPKADTPPEHLGTPWWPVKAAENHPGPVPESQHIPSPRDAYRYNGQAAGYFAKTGPPGIAGPAQIVASLAEGFAPILDWLSGGGFSRNYSSTSMLGIQRQLGNLKVQQEQFLLQSEILAQKQQESLERYGRVFTLATTNGADGKPLLSGPELEEAVSEIAAVDGDNSVAVALHNGGLPQAIKVLQKNRQQMLMLQAGNVALKKMSAGERSDAEEMASLGFKTDISGQGLDQSGAFSFDEGGGEEDQKAVGQQPIAQADTSDVESGDEGEGFVEMEKKKHASIPGGLTDDAIQAGRDAYNGDLDPKSYKAGGAARGLIEGIASDYRDRVQQIAHGPGDQESKLKRIEQLDPSAADKARGLLDYSLDPEKAIPAAHQARENMLALAHTLNPNWKEGNYRIVQKYHDANTSEGLRVQRVASLDGALFSLNNVLERIPEGEKVPARVMQAWLANKYSGDPKWDELYTALRDIATDTIAIQTGSGRPAVTLVNAMTAHMLQTNSPASIRAQSLIDMRAAYGQVVVLRDQFRSEVGDQNAQLPFLGRDINDKFLAYMRQNVYTGEMPSDAPPSLQGVSKRYNPKDHAAGMRPTTADHPGDELPPMAKKDIYEAWDKLDELNKLGTPEARKQAQWLRERLGYFADRGSI